MSRCIVFALVLTTASCSSKRDEESGSRSTENHSAHTDAPPSRDHAHHPGWTFRRVLDTALPLLGKSIDTVKKQHGKALVKKAAGYVLTLAPVGRRARATFVTLEGNERISELAILFDVANDSDAITAELTRRWGKPRTSREHKCRLRGCVYGTGPTVVARQIETRGVWLIRVIIKP